MKYLPDFPTFFIMFCTTIFAYGSRYNEIIAVVVWAGFVSIVVKSRKYPRVNDFFDTVF
ncbi:MAG: hypothetical protein WC667_13005 [Sulfurimonas sp.]